MVGGWYYCWSQGFSVERLCSVEYLGDLVAKLSGKRLENPHISFTYYLLLVSKYFVGGFTSIFIGMNLYIVDK